MQYTLLHHLFYITAAEVPANRKTVDFLNKIRNAMKIKSAICCLILSLLSCVKVEVQGPVETPVEKFPYKFEKNASVIINELSSSNSGLIKDEANEDPDWIEIYNRSDSAVNIEGYGLSDDISDIYKWRFGNITINPHQYVIVFASGKNVTEMRVKPIDDTLKFAEFEKWSDVTSGGKSTVVPNKYASILAMDSILKRKVISATFNQVDNRPELDWSGARIDFIFTRKFSSKKRDFSDYNAVQLNMTLEKNRNLILRLIQGQDIYPWLAPAFVLKGTGVENDIYTIPLIHGVNGVNIYYITSFSIGAPQYEFTETKFTISNMRFIHTGYNIHTNFKLSGSDSKLFLSKPDSIVQDTVAIKLIPTDMSLGKYDSNWVILKKPTPGMENVKEYYSSMTQAPQCVTKGGFYNTSVSVVLKSIDSCDIYYTLDGSVPSANSKKYTAPLPIDSTTVLRFAGIQNGSLRSEVQTETFFINFNSALPVVSIAVEPGAYFDPDTGMYMAGNGADSAYPFFGANFWKDIKVPAIIQFFETDKKLQFSEGVETSVMGNWSRAERKKSIAVKFNERTGKSVLEYPLFPKYKNLTKFRKFVLRNNGGNFGKTMIEDPMMQSLVDDRKIDYQKYRPVVVFINGKYFGLHQMMEAANEDYLYTNYNLNSEQVEFYDAGGNLVQGTAANWKKLNDYLYSQVKSKGADKDTLSDSSYAVVNTMMEVYNYIDYMAFEMYINNTDWPANNMRWWRSRTDGLWRWLIYDTDCGFGSWAQTESRNLASNNMFSFLTEKIESTDSAAYPNGRVWSFPLFALLQNSSFKEDFINRYATLLATNFSPSRVKNRIDELYSEISSEVPRDSACWGKSVYVKSKKEYIDRMKTFADDRHEYVYKHIMEYFSLSGTYYLTVKAYNGAVTVNNMHIPSSMYTGKYFKGVPVRLAAVAAQGRMFRKWSDGSTENPRRVNSDSDLSLEAICE